MLLAASSSDGCVDAAACVDRRLDDGAHVLMVAVADHAPAGVLAVHLTLRASYLAATPTHVILEYADAAIVYGYRLDVAEEGQIGRAERTGGTLHIRAYNDVACIDVQHARESERCAECMQYAAHTLAHASLRCPSTGVDGPARSARRACADGSRRSTHLHPPIAGVRSSPPPSSATGQRARCDSRLQRRARIGRVGTAPHRDRGATNARRTRPGWFRCTHTVDS
jgi:hypothetical protein